MALKIFFLFTGRNQTAFHTAKHNEAIHLAVKNQFEAEPSKVQE